MSAHRLLLLAAALACAAPVLADDAATAAALDRAARTPREAALGGALGSDELGRRLTRVLIADAHAAKIPAAPAFARRALEGWQKAPATGVKEISEALKRLPPRGFEAERAALVLASAMLPGQEEASFALASSELVRTGVDRVLTLAAHAAVLNTAANPEAAQAKTLEALKAHGDPSLQGALAAQFKRSWPDRAGALPPLKPIPRPISGGDASAPFRTPAKTAGGDPRAPGNAEAYKAFQEKAAALRAALPKTRTGLALARAALLLSRNPGSNPDEHEQINQMLSVIFRAPEQSFKDIAASIDRVPAGDPLARQVLIRLGARMKVGVTDRLAFLEGVLSRERGPADSGLGALSRLVALRELLEVSRDPAVLEPILRKALAAQPEARLRAAYLMEYGYVDGEGARRLRGH